MPSTGGKKKKMKDKDDPSPPPINNDADNNNNDSANICPSKNEELSKEYEFVGNLDYLKKKSRFGEECIGRKCLVLFDIAPEKPAAKRKSSKKKQKDDPDIKSRRPILGRVVAYKKQMLNEYEEDLEKIEFECLHLINFDDDEDEEEEEWWMDLSQLRDQGLLFWQDAVVERVAVKPKEPEPIEAKEIYGVGEEEESMEAEPDLPPEVANPKYPVGSEVFWHFVQPPKPGEDPNVQMDPDGSLTQLSQPTGLDLSGNVKAWPTKKNGFRYEVSLAGKSGGTILLPPSALWAAKASDKPSAKKKRKKRSDAGKSRSASEKRHSDAVKESPPTPKRQKVSQVPSLPWIDSMAEWLVSVPTAKKEGGKGSIISRSSARTIITKTKLLASGKGISYKKWAEAAAGDDEQSKNLTIFYHNKPMSNLKEFDHQIVKHDGEAHERSYGKDEQNGWLYRSTIHKIHQFQQYCLKHNLDMDAPPTTWQGLPEGQQPSQESPKPRKKKDSTGSSSNLKSPPPSQVPGTPEAEIVDNE